MGKLPRFVRIASQFTAMLMGVVGCSQPEPVGAGGVVSVVQQKCIETACERAMQEASLGSDRLAKRRVYMRFDGNTTTDPGADRACETVKSRIRKTAALVVDDASAADESVTFRVQRAGVDVAHSSIFGFSKVTTTAEVKIGLTFQKNGGSPIEKDGIGVARHKLSKWIGIPIGEKWE